MAQDYLKTWITKCSGLTGPLIFKLKTLGQEEIGNYMKTKGNLVRSPPSLARKVHPGHCTYEGAYTRLRFRNSSGRREQVLLLDLQENTAMVEAMLSTPSHPELRHDLTKAFGMFTIQERRVLYRILVQGQSLVQATKMMKSKSRRSWARWYKEKALLKLRRMLRDYER